MPRRFSADNRSVYLTGVREGETFDALYRLDLQTQQLEKVHAFDDARTSTTSSRISPIARSSA